MLDQEERDLLIRMDERLMAVHEKQDTILDRFTAHENQDRNDFKEVSERLSSLERRQNWMLGGASALAFVIGLGFTWIKMKLGF